jgi:hypothetical protein
MKHFVCYTTRDKEINSELLQSFSNELKKEGDVFIDMIDNDSEDKQSRVLSELDTSDILVLIETSSIYKSEWVSIELERAKAMNILIRIVKLDEIKKYLTYAV